MKNIVSRLCQLMGKYTHKASKGKYSPPINPMSEFAQKLVAAGWTGEDFQRVIESKGNASAEDLLYVNRNGIYVPSKSHKAAEEIMGKNFFGIEDAVKHFKVRPSRSQLAALSEIPYSEIRLRTCKNTHVLIADFQLSIVQMIDNKLLRHFFNDETLKQEDSWLKKNGFAWNEGAVACWRLVRIEPDEDSFNKSWLDQLAMFDKENNPAPVRVAVYSAIGHFLKTGERMFTRGMARCDERDIHHRRMTVGPFKEDGLRVQAWWDDVCYYEAGAASMSKTNLYVFNT